MTSKIFFHKMLRRNLAEKNAWTFLSTIIFFFTLPGFVLMNLENLKKMTWNPPHEMFLEAYLDISVVAGFLLLILAVFMGISGFSYLYSQEKTDFYHSLPVKREKLFLIQYTTGILCILLPYLVNSILAAVILKVNGFWGKGDLKWLLLMLAVNLVIFLVTYHLAILAVMLTGNLFTGVSAFLVLSLYGYLIKIFNLTMLELFYPSVLNVYHRGDLSICVGLFGEKLYLSPFYSFYQLWQEIAGFGEILSLIFFQLLAALLLLGAAMYCYHVRPSESSHRAIAFAWMQPYIKVLLVVPAGFLAATMFFSLFEYQKNGILLLLILVAVWLLSSIVEFCYTMDLKKSIKPGLSTCLAGLFLFVMILTGILDLFHINTYLPKKEKVESMSIYIPSLNGMYNYVEEDDYEIAMKSTYESFDPIYELSQQGVELYEIMGELPSRSLYGEEHMKLLSFHVRYNLKSGRSVERYYEVAEGEKALSNIEEIYDSWTYKKNILPVSYLDGKEVTDLYIDDMTSSVPRQILMNQDQIENLISTAQSEWYNLSFKQSREEEVLGYLTLTIPNENKITNNISIPIYKSFTNLRKLIEEAGIKIYSMEDSENIKEISIKWYNDSVGDNKEYIFQDPKEIRLILPETVPDLVTNIYRNQSIDYNYEVKLTWQDGVCSKNGALFLKGDKSKELTELLKKIK